MKKKNVNKSGWSILLSLCLGVILQLSNNPVLAQGNLQFNQVKLVGTVEIVPAGKVWKVETVLFSAGVAGVISTTGAQWVGQAAGNNYNTEKHILINSTLVAVYASGSTIAGGSGAPITSAFMTFNFPIWLPESSTLAASTGVYRISVIEFNIVP